MIKRRSVFLLIEAVLAIIYAAAVLPTGSVYMHRRELIDIGPTLVINFVLMLVLYFLLTYVIRRKRIIFRILWFHFSYSCICINYHAFFQQDTYLDIGFMSDPEPRARFFVGLLLAIITVVILEMNHYYYRKANRQVPDQ